MPPILHQTGALVRHDHAQLVRVGLHQHRAAPRAAVPGDVGERLPDHRDHVGHEALDDGVQGRGPVRAGPGARRRAHDDVAVGSSVRGAIDATAVAATLSELRGLPPSNPSVGLDAALIALSGRVRLREGVTRTSEEIITELWADVFGRREEGGDQGKAGAPTGATSCPS